MILAEDSSYFLVIHSEKFLRDTRTLWQCIYYLLFNVCINFYVRYTRALLMIKFSIPMTILHYLSHLQLCNNTFDDDETCLIRLKQAHYNFQHFKKYVTNNIKFGYGVNSDLYYGRWFSLTIM